jgi:hypothetical protein
MDVKLIPGDQKRRALTAGMFDSKIYLVDTQEGYLQAGLRCLDSRRRSDVDAADPLDYK